MYNWNFSSIFHVGSPKFLYIIMLIFHITLLKIVFWLLILKDSLNLLTKLCMDIYIVRNIITLPKTFYLCLMQYHTQFWLNVLKKPFCLFMSKAFFYETLNWNHTKNTMWLDCMGNVEFKGNYGQMWCSVEQTSWDQLVQGQRSFLWF